MGTKKAEAGDSAEVEGCGTFFDAVSDQNMERVRDLLRLDDTSEEAKSHREWLVNEKTWADWRALHAAAESGNLSMVKVWTLTQFYSVFFFCKKSLICLEGKSMTPQRGNTILFRSSQQLPRLRLGPSKGFLS